MLVNCFVSKILNIKYLIRIITNEQNREIARREKTKGKSKWEKKYAQQQRVAAARDLTAGEMEAIAIRERNNAAKSAGLV